MADARKTWSQLDTLFADNTAGAISPQDLRNGFTALEPNTSTSSPAASDDGTDGYDVGHAWLKVDGSGNPVALFRCLANDTGAAVWKQVWPPLVDDLDLSGTDVADLSSGEATDGQVATADGSGGVAWEDPAGGVAGPASSVDGNLAAFDGTSGDTLKDSGKAASDFATAAQGTLAGTAVQPGDDAADLGSGTATDGQVLTADGSGGAAWEDAASGVGNVTGPASSTDGNLAVFDGTDGKKLKDGGSPTTAFSGAYLMQGSAQSIPSSVDTALSFGSSDVQFDTDTFWSSAHPTRLTAPASGTYRVEAYVRMGALQAGERCTMSVQANGNTTVTAVQQVEAATGGTGNVGTSSSGIVQLAAGDYVEAMAFQSNAGSKNTIPTGCTLLIEKVG